MTMGPLEVLAQTGVEVLAPQWVLVLEMMARCEPSSLVTTQSQPPYLALPGRCEQGWLHHTPAVPKARSEVLMGDPLMKPPLLVACRRMPLRCTLRPPSGVESLGLHDVHEKQHQICCAQNVGMMVDLPPKCCWLSSIFESQWATQSPHLAVAVAAVSLMLSLQCVLAGQTSLVLLLPQMLVAQVLPQAARVPEAPCLPTALTILAPPAAVQTTFLASCRRCPSPAQS
mmetsp:Transcript_9813/g.22339  ORF Transcript_9813/g.22339 Transcript_9813/m.22339 type:complete len:228 (-) Transcript_9813:1347-2030(-)